MIDVTMWLRHWPEVIESVEVDPADGFEDSDIDDAICAVCSTHGIQYDPDSIAEHVEYSVNYAA